MSKEPRRGIGSSHSGKPPPDKLFHVIVVLGSAMVAGGACGQSNSRGRDHGGGSGSGGRDDGGSAGSGGVFSIAGMSATGGTFAGAPTGGTAGGLLTGGTGSDPPECGPGAAGETQAGGAPNSADDCANSAQFWCVAYAPEPVDCVCDPAAPLAPECCPGSNFTCRGGYDPPIGCRCELNIITR